MHRDISPGNVLIYRAPEEKDPSDAPSIVSKSFYLCSFILYLEIN